jgi:Ca2+-binding EF-hand superfamily protein
MLRTLPFTSSMPHPATQRYAGSDGQLHVSEQLVARKEKLTQLHMVHQGKQLQRVGEASIYGPPAYRTSGLSAHPFRGPKEWQNDGSRRDLDFTLDLPVKTPPPEVGGVTVDLIIQGLRRRMQQRGLECIFGMEKFYKSMDKDGNGTLEYPEFRDGLMQHGLLQNDAECKAIFQSFDEDRSGFLDWREFMSLVKGQLNPVRKQIVDEAFDLLDISGNGVVDAEDLKERYRTFAHPDVRAGIRTEEEVFSEFLENFDVLCSDASVSKVEFQKYYESMSATIPNDAFFVAMLRNTWHLAGAKDGHCLRVHITRRAGTEMKDPKAWGHDIAKTIEIRPDLGLQRHDPRFYEEAAKRCNEMGYPDVGNIEVLGRY